jgi:hypothetical protein
VGVHSLYAHEKGRDALPLTFVRCWPTTLTAGFNDGCRKIAANNHGATNGERRRFSKMNHDLCRKFAAIANESAKDHYRAA